MTKLRQLTNIPALLFFVILKLINKYILKDKVKINVKEVLIGWIIIFCFNLFCVIFDFPYPIGIQLPSGSFDGGRVHYCASLGYVIKIEKNSIFVDDARGIKTYVDFLFVDLDYNNNTIQ